MMSRARTTGAVMREIVLGAALALAPAQLAHAQDAPPAAPPSTTDAPPTPEADAEAKRLFQEGKTKLDAGAYAEAAELFQRAYQLSRRPSLLYNQAVALHKAGRSRDALVLARDARTQMPQEKLAHLDALIEELESVIKEDPAAREYFQIAQARMQQGLYAEAAVGFGEAYKLSGHPEMRLNQARAMAKAGDAQGALAVVKSAIESMPASSPLRVTGSVLRASLEGELASESKRRGIVRVVTEPADALVRLDGALLGRVADGAAAATVTAGPHQLDVSRQGYLSITRGIEVIGEQTLTQTIALQYAPCESPGQRRVRSAPEFCCWPGQTVQEGTCTGSPTECPAGMRATKGGCSAPVAAAPAMGGVAQAPAEPEKKPEKPVKNSINIDLVMMPMLVLLSDDPLGEDIGGGFAHNFRLGYRAHRLLSLEAGYGFWVGAGEEYIQAQHATYLLAGLHRSKRRQRGTRDLWVRSGIMPYFRTVSLERSAVITERKGWGFPISIGVNGMKGTNFGVGFELHYEWIKISEACEHGFGRGCVEGGKMMRLGMALSFNWSAP